MPCSLSTVSWTLILTPVLLYNLDWLWCRATSMGIAMTYDVILRKKQDKYIARVRDWPEVVIEEETREAALTQIKQQLMAYLSQPPEVIPIELEPAATGEHPWLQFAGMWADDPTWDDFVTEVAAYRQEMDKADAEA